MTIADGSQHSLAYVAESTFGTTPTSPTLTPFRHTGATLGLDKTLLESAEISSTREVKYIRHGNKQVGRDVPFELSYGSQDDMIEAVLGGTWSTQVDSGAITADAASGTFTRSTGSFVTDGFAVYDIVTASGYTNAGNNGRFLVTAVSATVLTVTPIEGQTMATESGGGDEQFIAEATVKNGTTRRYFTFQRYFADTGDYVVLTGLNADSLSLDIGVDAMVTGSVSFIGKDISTATSAISGSSTSAETTTEGMDSYTGSLYDNGSSFAAATALTLECTNGLERTFTVFTDTTSLPSIKKFRASGTLTAYFEDLTMYDKFINETSSSIAFTLTDPAGNSYWVYLPSVKYNAGNPDVSGEGTVTLALDWQAVRSAAANATMIVQRIPA